MEPLLLIWNLFSVITYNQLVLFGPKHYLSMVPASKLRPGATSFTYQFTSILAPDLGMNVTGQGAPATSEVLIAAVGPQWPGFPIARNDSVHYVR